MGVFSSKSKTTQTTTNTTNVTDNRVGVSATDFGTAIAASDGASVTITDGGAIALASDITSQALQILEDNTTQIQQDASDATAAVIGLGSDVSQFGSDVADTLADGHQDNVDALADLTDALQATTQDLVDKNADLVRQIDANRSADLSASLSEIRSLSRGAIDEALAFGRDVNDDAFSITRSVVGELADDTDASRAFALDTIDRVLEEDRSQDERSLEQIQKTLVMIVAIAGAVIVAPQIFKR